MATKTKTTEVVVNATAIKTAVQTWAKAETSAIWALIKLISKGITGLEGDAKKMRLSALKTWVNQSAQEVWGDAAKDHDAHISKIFKIASNATPEHYVRWERQGTGFYKAYSEFAIPQRNPAKSASTSASKSKPETVRIDTKTGEPIKVDEEVIGAQKGVGTQIEGFTPAQAGAAAKESLPAPPPVDLTEAWAVRIDADRSLWKTLVGHLTEKKHTVMEPNMVLDLMTAVSKKDTLFRNTIGVLLQNEFIKGHVIGFIKDNPTMFDGISVG